ncbi:MAG: hypothetical protein RR086_05205, partial [Clostridia bacterium]
LKGAIILALSMYVCLSIVMRFCKKENLTSTRSLLNKISYPLRNVTSIVIYIGTLMLISSNLSSLNSMLAYAFDTSFSVPIYSALCVCICGLILMRKIKAIKVFCAITVPIVITFMLITTLYAYTRTTAIGTKEPTTYSGISYSLFNSVMLLATISENSKKLSHRELRLTALLSAVALSSLVYIIATVCINVNSSAPLLTIALSISPILYYYGIVSVVLSTMSTVLSCAYMLISPITELIGDKMCGVCIVMFVALILSMAGFGLLTGIFYPSLSILGLIIMCLIVIKRIDCYKFDTKKAIFSRNR